LEGEGDCSGEILKKNTGWHKIRSQITCSSALNDQYIFVIKGSILPKHLLAAYFCNKQT
ncbi:hypothetical protein T03_17534, partial [Trichinella britovi]